MATTKTARAQLSKDLGDFFESTITGDPCGCDLNTIEDSQLIDEGGNNQDHFLTDLTTIWVEGGQEDCCCMAIGPTSDEARRVDRDNSSLSTGILQTFRNFSAQVTTGAVYELHRLFTAAEKDRAVTVALQLVVPLVWKHLVVDVDMVADQFDYDMTALTDDCCNSVSFYRNIPHQVGKVSPSDSELVVPLHNWQIRNGTDLHIYSRPRSGESLRLYGITEPVLADLDNGELLIVSARAAIYLLETAIQGTRVDQRELFLVLLQNARSMYAERVRQHMKMAPARQLQSEAYAQNLIDTDWGIP